MFCMDVFPLDPDVSKSCSQMFTASSDSVSFLIPMMFTGRQPGGPRSTAFLWSLPWVCVQGPRSPREEDVWVCGTCKWLFSLTGCHGPINYVYGASVTPDTGGEMRLPEIKERSGITEKCTGWQNKWKNQICLHLYVPRCCVFCITFEEFYNMLWLFTEDDTFLSEK